MNKNKNEEKLIDDIKKKYRDNMSDEQKQKQKDYQIEYQKKYYAAKKLNKIINDNKINDNKIIDDNDNDCNGTRTHNHLVHKRTLNHLAKLAK